MTTYSVKFMSGALQGAWMRGQTTKDLVKLYNRLAELLGTDIGHLYKGAFVRDSEGHPTVFTYKGENGQFSAALYIVKEYDF